MLLQNINDLVFAHSLTHSLTTTMLFINIFAPLFIYHIIVKVRFLKKISSVQSCFCTYGFYARSVGRYVAEASSPNGLQTVS